MTFTEGKVRILVVLFLQSAIWSLSACAPINPVQLSRWDDDPWFRRFTTPRPFVWPTFPPFFWTIDPGTWNRITVPPIDYTHHSEDDTQLKLVIFLPVLLLSALIFVCKYVICGKGESSTSSSSATVHPPPARISRPLLNLSEQPSQHRSRPQSMANTERTSQGTRHGSSTAASSSAAASANSFGDKPPGYSDVVLSDLSVGSVKFPEVSPKVPETPPPKYDDGNFPRY